MADINTVLRQLQAGVQSAHAKHGEQSRMLQQVGGEHALIRQELDRQRRELQTLADALASVNGGGGGSLAQSDGEVNWKDHIMYISQIPGSRIPYDLVATIPIGSDVSSTQQTALTISQDGPFVAVARYAVFQSTHQFTLTDDGGVATTFQGRSYGRFRPVHSVCDFNDSQALQPIVGVAAPGTGAGIYASPSNHSGFRTMEFDGMIRMYDQGSSYPRSNTDVPSSAWIDQNNGVFQLGALDYFERSSVIQFEVTPSHINNPAAGNVQQFAGAGGVFPAIDSQYDVHEGILYLILHGFRIKQPPGAVRLT